MTDAAQKQPTVADLKDDREVLKTTAKNNGSTVHLDADCRYIALADRELYPKRAGILFGHQEVCRFCWDNYRDEEVSNDE